ncbi:MAG: hypothetical protein WAN50_01670 [Minisyncoccia bacterium]
MNKKSSLLYYAIGAFVLVFIVVIAVSVLNKTKSSEQTSQTANVPAASTTGTAAAGVTNTAAANAPAASSLVGTWVSATPGKGMQGSGKIVLAHSSTAVTTSGDVTIVIQKVENGTAVGTLSYSNLCTTEVITLTGASPVTEKPQCTSVAGRPVQLQVNGNSLSFSGQAETGANITFTGTQSGDTVSGTFTRSSQYGEISGTFNLKRSNG